MLRAVGIGAIALVDYSLLVLLFSMLPGVFGPVGFTHLARVYLYRNQPPRRDSASGAGWHEAVPRGRFVLDWTPGHSAKEGLPWDTRSVTDSLPTAP